jgi:ATP diphosphatase
MAEEAGLFNFADVIEAISTKMIRRHPHVFGDEIARKAGMANGAWEKIKAQEKADKTRTKAKTKNTDNNSVSLLDDIHSTLPALQSAVKLQRRASRVGFDWNNPNKVINKLREELDEVEEAISTGDSRKIEGEIGDLLFAVANLARHMDLKPDNALRITNQKFRKRFSHIEQRLASANRSLEDAGLDEMEALWIEAKDLE